MKKRYLIIILTILALPVLFHSSSFAQSEKDPEELMKEGDRLYREKRYEEASKIYDEAYEIVSREAVPIEEGEELPENIIEDADELYKDGEYKEAAALYDKAYETYVNIAERIGVEREDRIRKLEELKALRQQKLGKEEAAMLKQEYITELKERRHLDKTKRRAELNAQATSKKRQAALNKQYVREQNIRYKDIRAQKRARREAEREAIILARKRMKEEKEFAKLAKRAPKEAPEIVTAMAPEPAVEEEVFVEEPVSETVDAKSIEREAKRLEAEKSRAEKRLAREKKRRAKGEKKREKLAAIKIALRERIARIEEVRFKRRQDKNAKEKEGFKAATIKKAARCKSEVDKYALRSAPDAERLSRARRLVDRADGYFDKEMYKEAGKLYNRAILTLRGKIH